MDIAQSAARSAWLLEESAAFCHAAGFIESNDPNVLVSDYISASDPRHVTFKQVLGLACICPRGPRHRLKCNLFLLNVCMKIFEGV